jgi:hypothetical protein
MSKHRGRRVPPDPQTIRRADVKTTLPNESDWDAAETLRTLDAHLIAAGVAQNKQTGLYHTWVSLYGTDLTSWYVGPDGKEARAFLLAIKKLYSEWSYTEDDIDSMNALLEVAIERSTDRGAVLPDDQVKEQLAKVAEFQLRKN